MTGKQEDKKLIIVLGPTASGKTTLGIDLAREYHTEVLSADSRQFYKEMKTGTATPSQEELDMVPHHFIGNLSVTDYYNVSRYEQDVLDLLEKLFRTKDDAVMVGGSGLYIDAVCHGIDDLPDPDEELRASLKEQYEAGGIAFLQQRLIELDPEYYEEVDQSNPNRLIRAVEVCIQTGDKFSKLRRQRYKDRPFRIVKIGLDRPREELFNRINLRVEQMVADGLVEEARGLLAYRDQNALNTVGYKEVFRYLDGEIDLEQAIKDIQTNTRRYAKRQLTWFKKDPMVRWIHPDDIEEIKAYINR